MVTDVTPSSTIERSVTGIVQVLAVVIGVGVLLAGLLGIALTAVGDYTASVPLVASERLWPELGGPADSSGTSVRYDGVRIITDAAPLSSLLLRLASWGLYGAVVLGGCVFAILLCRRLRRGRPFTTLARAWMTGLGLLAIAAAVLAPALQLEGVAAMVDHLDFVVYDASTDSYLEAGSPGVAEALWPDRFDRLGPVIRHIDWLLAGFGGILVVVSFAFRRGQRLQRETEGLV